MASLGLIARAPLFFIVAILIKATSPGPVLFRQQRVGKDCELFGLYKFRTMYVDRADQTGIAQTQARDGRVTSIGGFLRRTSIDELPQLVNILLGDMSVVGPRPHVPNMLAAGIDYRDLVPYYDVRSRVRPGLTGWAQANGLRGPTVNALTARARVNHDIAYIQNMSFGLDAKIIWLTLKREFITGTGV